MERTAILELKPNDIKLTIYDLNTENFYSVLDIFSMPISLGEQSENDQIAKPSQVKETIVVIKQMQEIIAKNNVKTVFPFVSSDLAGLINLGSFLEEILNSTSLNFKTVSLADQAKILHSSVIESLDVSRGIIISIENTKSSIVSFSRKSIIGVAQIPFGAKTITQIVESLPKEEQIPAISKIVKEELSKHNFLSCIEPEVQVVGVNEFFSSLGRLMRKTTRYPFEKAHGYETSFSEFSKFCDFVAGFDLDKTKKIKGISQDRSDVFFNGLHIIKNILEFLNAQSFVICEKGITNGLMLASAPQPLEKPLWDLLTFSIRKNQSLYLPKSENAIHVCALATALFNHLKIVSKISRTVFKSLKVAANFYDVGKRISFFNLPKNGYNVILGMDLDGLTHKEQVLAAFICLCQDPDAFELSLWVGFKDLLNEEDLVCVKKLGLILALASKLDCRKKQVVRDLNCEILGDTVILKAESSGKAELTQFEVNEASKLRESFKKIFGKNLQIL
ncbi:MAG: hypothetical protein WCR30_03630 [Clostridia bacterium]